MKAKLVEYAKTTDEAGNTIEVKIWQVPKDRHRPHGYKYSLVYIVNNERVIGYDNSEGKGDHKHHRGKEAAYEFKNADKLFRDFYHDIRRFKNES